VTQNGKVIDVIKESCPGYCNIEVENGKLIIGNDYGSEDIILYETPDLSGTPWEPFIVENGKVIHNTNLSHKELTVRNGGVASNTVVGYDGELEVQQGGKVVNTTINGGKMIVSSGGTAERVLYNGFADIVISSGGYASVVFNPWQQNIMAESGAVVTTLFENKVFYGNEEQGTILADNRFENLHVESGNSAVVLSYGIIDGVTVDDYSSLHVSSGGVITGNWNFSDMAYIYMEQGAELNLDLRKQTVEAKPLFNNLPYCSTITITVNPDQAPGEYNICSSGIMTDITLKDTNRTYDTFSPWYGSGTVYRGNRFTLDYDYENNIQKLVVKENTTENRTFVSSGGNLRVTIPHYSGAALRVALDGKALGHVAYPPYVMDLGKPEAGDHVLTLTLLGNRENAFGPLHRADVTNSWVGPNAWRTTDAEWTESYWLTPLGLRTAPWLEETDE
jgi:autotransporter passenger strand-loop-strand repeat protein